MSRLSISLLGRFQVMLDGKSVSGFDSDKVRALLAYLAIEAGRPHRREMLAGLLWPDLSERAARTNLRNALANLRKAIGDHQVSPPFLHISKQTIQFNTDSNYWLDVANFSTLSEIDEAAPLAIEHLEEVVTLYRGLFLEGFSYRDSDLLEDWIRLQREKLHRQTLEALHLLANHYEKQGAYDQALSFAWRQVELEPSQEGGHQQVIRLLAITGRRSEALIQFQRCKQALAEELGVEPAVETKDLYKKILAEQPIKQIEDQKDTPIPRHNLPIQTTPFVGREVEVKALAKLLTDPTHRLITILGLGGMGKTRLALEVAATQLTRFKHGVYFVPLAPVDFPETIIPTIAKALNFTFYQGSSPEQQLRDYLREKHILLVLDNFEHLLDGGRLVADLLNRVLDLRILVTSRERLNLREEHLFPIAGIDFPGRGIYEKDLADSQNGTYLEEARNYSSIELFVQSARHVCPNFKLIGKNLVPVAQICRLLQGMPLGILLAAGWVELLTPSEIIEEISHNLDFLETELRDVPERQRNIRLVFDNSWQLLSEPEQKVFQELSIFQGGFTRQAAQDVTGASLRTLRALVNKCFLYRTPSGRYGIHELLRQYGAEKLAEAQATKAVIHDRHSAYYCAFLQQRETDLKSSRQQIALAEIEAESDNTWAAWNWAVEQEKLEHLERALDGLGRFYEWRGLSWQGQMACQLAIQKLQCSTLDNKQRLQARLLTWQSIFCQNLGQTELANKLLQQSLALLDIQALANRDIRPEKAFALLEMGQMMLSSDLEEAKQLFEQSLVLYQALLDRWGIAQVLTSLGLITFNLGNYTRAKDFVQESLAIQHELGDQQGAAYSLRILAEVVRNQWQFEEAKQLQEASLSFLREIGDRTSLANSLSEFGATLVGLGEYGEARTQLEEAVTICHDLGLRNLLAASNNRLGVTKIYLGQYEQARPHIQLSLNISREVGNWPLVGISLYTLGMTALGEASYAEAKELFRESSTILQSLGLRGVLGRVSACLGYAERGLSDSSRAQQYLCKALQIAVETGSFYPTCISLPGIALLLADRHETERAVEVYALVSRFPYVANSQWFEDIAGHHIRTITATLPPHMVRVVQEQGKARDLWKTAAELLAELNIE